MFTKQGSFKYVHSSRESKLRSFAADLDEFAALVARLGRRAAANAELSPEEVKYAARFTTGNNNPKVRVHCIQYISRYSPLVTNEFKRLKMSATRRRSR